MQDLYVGDLGDLANNALLRVLCGTPQDPVPGMRLGIIWYRNKSKGQYGNEIGYLNPSKYNHETYGECDPHLYSELQKLVGRSMERSEKRRIEDIINSPILRADTQHHETLLPRSGGRKYREAWLEQAVANTSQADVIFLNPDNGIAAKGVAKLQYIHPWELGRLLREAKILVIYQHGQRSDWVTNTANLLRSAPVSAEHRWVVRWHRAPKRGYFIVAQTEEEKDKIDNRLKVLKKSLWVNRGHFSSEEA